MSNLKVSTGQIDQSSDFNFTGELKSTGKEVAVLNGVSSTSYLYGVDGVLVSSTEVLSGGNRVTVYEYVDGNIDKAIETYKGEVVTSTYIYTDGVLTGVTLS